MSIEKLASHSPDGQNGNIFPVNFIKLGEGEGIFSRTHFHGVTRAAEVLNEPHTALFGGEDGLYFYRVISEKWKSALQENGILAFEVGINEAEDVAKILKTNGFKNIGVKKDLIGIERVVFGTVNSL